ncbi:MAG: prolipoprotein diacylglyceryl transferase [Dehalococcoidia bacterium]|nr:prolipoprotein diacylglyceryl transferase [Dehalococcoidia bacterium]
MIHIGVDPVALSIGSIELRWYGIMVSLAVLTGITVPWMLARKEEGTGGITRDQVLSLAIWAVPGGVVGARLIHVIDNWSYYSSNPSDIIGGSGMGIFGAILGGTFTAVAYARIKKISVGQMADVGAFGLILAQVVGRIGCILNGCCTGEPTSLPWGVIYTNPNTGADSIAQQTAVHPTHAYEILWDLIVFALMWSMRKRVKPAGALFLIYISAYSAGRFFISFLRTNDTGFLGLQQAQIVSLLVLGVAIGWLIQLYRKPLTDSGSISEPETDDVS